MPGIKAGVWATGFGDGSHNRIWGSQWGLGVSAALKGQGQWGRKNRDSGRWRPTLLLLPRSLVARRHVHDAVRVDVEGHLDLRHAPGRRRDPDLQMAANGSVRHSALQRQRTAHATAPREIQLGKTTTT